MQDRQALTAQQAALRLGKQPRTVYELMQKGRLGSVHRGRRVYTTEDALAAYARAEEQLIPGSALGAPEAGPSPLVEDWHRLTQRGVGLKEPLQKYLLQHFGRHMDEAEAGSV